MEDHYRVEKHVDCNYFMSPHETEYAIIKACEDLLNNMGYALSFMTSEDPYNRQLVIRLSADRIRYEQNTTFINTWKPNETDLKAMLDAGHETFVRIFSQDAKMDGGADDGRT